MTENILSSDEVQKIEEDAKDEATFRTTVMLNQKYLFKSFEEHIKTSTEFREKVISLDATVKDHTKLVWFSFTVVIGIAVYIVTRGGI